MMRARRFVEITTAGFAMLGAVLACGEEPAPPAPVARPVKVVVIGDASQGRTLEYPGEISPAQNAEIGFEVAGKLIEFPVRESQLVERGAVLAKLDPRDYQSSYDAAAAQAGQTKTDAERASILFKENVASKQENEKAQRNWEVAQARAEKAQKALADTVLRAPFAGTVARKIADDFANVQAKEPVVILQTGTALEIVINMPEQDFARVRPGSTVEQINEGLVADVIVSSLPDHEFPAKLKEFATTADPTTRTFAVTFSFDAPDDVNVVPGMTAKIVGVGRDAGGSASVQIPTQSVKEDETGEPYVWVVAAGNKVKKAPVVLGGFTGGSVEVTSGLSKGDQVVASGVQQLHEGVEVRPVVD